MHARADEHASEPKISLGGTGSSSDKGKSSPEDRAAPPFPAEGALAGSYRQSPTALNRFGGMSKQCPRVLGTKARGVVCLPVHHDLSLQPRGTPAGHLRSTGSHHRS